MGCAGFSGVSGAAAAASAGRGDSPPVLLGKMDAGDGKADARDGKADAQQRLTVGRSAEAEEAKASSSLEEDSIVLKLGKLDRLQKKGVVEMIDATGAASAPRMSIGSVSDLGPTSFAEKAIGQTGDELDLSQCGLGYTCRKGLKKGSPNQDSWLVLRTGAFSIYGVFDGHGEAGHEVSHFVKENLPKLILKDPRFRTPEMPAMLRDAFRTTQGLIAIADRAKRFSARLSGTTATVCVHDHAKGKLTVAHVADSTCVLGRKRGADGAAGEAVRLTRDHKPELKDERARIEAKVICVFICIYVLYVYICKYVHT